MPEPRIEDAMVQIANMGKSYAVYYRRVSDDFQVVVNCRTMATHASPSVAILQTLNMLKGDEKIEVTRCDLECLVRGVRLHAKATLADDVARRLEKEVLDA